MKTVILLLWLGTLVYCHDVPLGNSFTIDCVTSSLSTPNATIQFLDPNGNVVGADPTERVYAKQENGVLRLTISKSVFKDGGDWVCTKMADNNMREDIMKFNLYIASPRIDDISKCVEDTVPICYKTIESKLIDPNFYSERCRLIGQMEICMYNKVNHTCPYFSHSTPKYVKSIVQKFEKLANCSVKEHNKVPLGDSFTIDCDASSLSTPNATIQFLNSKGEVVGMDSMERVYVTRENNVLRLTISKSVSEDRGDWVCTKMAADNTRDDIMKFTLYITSPRIKETSDCVSNIVHSCLYSMLNNITKTMSLTETCGLMSKMGKCMYSRINQSCKNDSTKYAEDVFNQYRNMYNCSLLEHKNETLKCVEDTAVSCITEAANELITRNSHTEKCQIVNEMETCIYSKVAQMCKNQPNGTSKFLHELVQQVRNTNNCNIKKDKNDSCGLNGVMRCKQIFLPVLTNLASQNNDVSKSSGCLKVTKYEACSSTAMKQCNDLTKKQFKIQIDKEIQTYTKKFGCNVSNSGNCNREYVKVCSLKLQSEYHKLGLNNTPDAACRLHDMYSSCVRKAVKNCNEGVKTSMEDTLKRARKLACDTDDCSQKVFMCSRHLSLNNSSMGLTDDSINRHQQCKKYTMFESCVNNVINECDVALKQQYRSQLVQTQRAYNMRFGCNFTDAGECSIKDINQCALDFNNKSLALTSNNPHDGLCMLARVFKSCILKAIKNCDEVVKISLKDLLNTEQMLNCDKPDKGDCGKKVRSCRRAFGLNKSSMELNNSSISKHQQCRKFLLYESCVRNVTKGCDVALQQLFKHQLDQKKRSHNKKFNCNYTGAGECQLEDVQQCGLTFQADVARLGNNFTHEKFCMLDGVFRSCVRKATKNCDKEKKMAVDDLLKNITSVNCDKSTKDECKLEDVPQCVLNFTAAINKFGSNITYERVCMLEGVLRSCMREVTKACSTEAKKAVEDQLKNLMAFNCDKFGKDECKLEDVPQCELNFMAAINKFGSNITYERVCMIYMKLKSCVHKAILNCPEMVKNPILVQLKSPLDSNCSDTYQGGCNMDDLQQCVQNFGTGFNHYGSNITDDKVCMLKEVFKSCVHQATKNCDKQTKMMVDNLHKNLTTVNCDKSGQGSCNTTGVEKCKQKYSPKSSGPDLTPDENCMLTKRYISCVRKVMENCGEEKKKVWEKVLTVEFEFNCLILDTGTNAPSTQAPMTKASAADSTTVTTNGSCNRTDVKKCEQKYSPKSSGPDLTPDENCMLTKRYISCVRKVMENCGEQKKKVWEKVLTVEFEFNCLILDTGTNATSTQVPMTKASATDSTTVTTKGSCNRTGIKKCEQKDSPKSSGPDLTPDETCMLTKLYVSCVRKAIENCDEQEKKLEEYILDAELLLNCPIPDKVTKPSAITTNEPTTTLSTTTTSETTAQNTVMSDTNAPSTQTPLPNVAATDAATATTTSQSCDYMSLWDGCLKKMVNYITDNCSFVTARGTCVFNDAKTSCSMETQTQKSVKDVLLTVGVDALFLSNCNYTITATGV